MPADDPSVSESASGAQPARATSPASSPSPALANQIQADIARLVQEGVRSLEQRKRSLELEIEKLERRRDRIEAEMNSTFAGASQDLAVRIQSFKEYLVGSLQDLATSAEQLQLTVPVPEREVAAPPEPPANQLEPRPVMGGAGGFWQDSERIQSLLDQYRLRPDYYGPAWQLRRTFEPIHADRVAYWFFEQGGRGAVKSLNSRLQNVLVASAVISILHTMQGDRLRVLVLANSPERLGDWRRGFQDCLGVSRADFGAGRGIMLFESPDPMAQRAERLVETQYLPLIIIDESEGQVPLSLLQFPLWLAIAPDPTYPTSDAYEFY